MIRLQRLIAFGVFVQLLAVSGAFAQTNRDDDYGRRSDRDGFWAVRGGVGFTEGPDSFLMNIDFEAMPRDEVAVGLGVQLGVEDDFVIVSPMIFTRFIFDMSGFKNETARQLRPFVQGGAGITYIDVDRRGRDRDETDFLLNVGVGLDFPLDDTVSIGTRMLVNLIPGEVLGQRVYFSWELVSVRYTW